MDDKMISFDTNVTVELVSSSGGWNFYKFTAESDQPMGAGQHNIGFKLKNPAGELLDIQAFAGSVSEFVDDIPWLGSNSYTTQGASWNPRQLPDGSNLLMRYTATGIVVRVGMTGFVAASN